MARTIVTERLDARRAKDIQRAIELLRTGRLVAFPTETVYGLGADGLDPDAVERIFSAKGRPADNPLILHVADLDAAAPLWVASDREWERAQRCAAALWPGPLTLVLPAAACVPPIVTAGLGSVAVRAPEHPVARELLAGVCRPVAAPSANLSGRPSPTTAEHVAATLDGRIDAILDGGAAEVGVESTVVDLRGERPTVLRPGGISARTLAEALGEPVEAYDADRRAGGSPGLRHRHYAPAVGRLDTVEDCDLGAAWIATGGLLLFARTAAALRARHGERSGPIVTLPDEPAEAMRQLYACLYRLEQSSTREWSLELPEPSERWTAVRDRLLRASAGSRPETPGDPAAEGV